MIKNLVPRTWYRCTLEYIGRGYLLRWVPVIMIANALHYYVDHPAKYDTDTWVMYGLWSGLILGGGAIFVLMVMSWLILIAITR